MAGKFHHESIYRGPELLAKLSRLRVTLCGIGAIGSNLADNLVRQGVTSLRAIELVPRAIGRASCRERV